MRIDFTEQKQMKKLIISMVCFFPLTGCYQYTKPPFSQSEMTSLRDSILAKQIVSAIANIPKSEETQEMVDALKEIDVVYEISPSSVIA